MNIEELSLNIDQKIAQIDKQVANLQHKLSTADIADQSAKDRTRKDIAALEQIKIKLQKSRSIMWKAHELQRGTDQRRLREKRWLGIGLCLVSGIGLMVILIVVLTGN
jgi:hypothetical protein